MSKFWVDNKQGEVSYFQFDHSIQIGNQTDKHSGSMDRLADTQTISQIYRLTYSWMDG